MRGGGSGGGSVRGEEGVCDGRGGRVRGGGSVRGEEGVCDGRGGRVRGGGSVEGRVLEEGE